MGWILLAAFIAGGLGLVLGLIEIVFYIWLGALVICGALVLGARLLGWMLR